MPATLRHFAINADDVGRARTFYESVFGWRFDPWGPPGFYQIKNAGQGVLGALQQRRELAPGVRMSGYEASMGVADLRATMTAIEASGGRILMQPYRIDGVGELIYFEDTEGNLVGAMQYEPDFRFP
ncbi:VOC family protein [Duganella sp. FT80W]|uniref:VOC family protein n=1 Tax=Duganella guangzhouensis TaxID=2666084 RepID=A0A6I2L301_9BURK|nr:VOC family protein [Duganella guangzhouensis]MRW92172.1 VOC family protein [Duganella guangzhouensis]